jgi:hypothetical protein
LFCTPHFQSATCTAIAGFCLLQASVRYSSFDFSEVKKVDWEMEIMENTNKSFVEIKTEIDTASFKVRTPLMQVEINKSF